MPVAAHQLEDSEDEVQDSPRIASWREHFLTVCPPAPANDPAILLWAHELAGVAEERVAALEARIAQLEDLVGSDELTGLLNRRGFLNVFACANAAATRAGPRGVIVICDLDGFKEVNDRLGHAEGDEQLRRVAGILRRKTRKMDAVARLGGDEFAILLIGASAAIAKRKCQCLGRLISAIGLGASFGVATFDGSISEDVVLHRADMAMYEDKRRHAAQSADIRAEDASQL